MFTNILSESRDGILPRLLRVGRACCTLLFLATLFGNLPTIAVAQEDRKASLRLGEQVTLWVGGTGEVRMSSVMLSTQEQREMANHVLNVPQGINSNGSSPLTRPSVTVKPSVVRLSFVSLEPASGRDERLLVLENGYDQVFRYRATIFRGNEGEPSSVCSVNPKLVGYEYWPYPINKIEISHIIFEVDDHSGKIVCG